MVSTLLNYALHRSLKQLSPLCLILYTFIEGGGTNPLGPLLSSIPQQNTIPLFYTQPHQK